MTIENKLQEIIKSIDNLPPFPEIVNRILIMAQDPDVDTNEIVRTVSHDQAVTANCLRLCNSSYFGLRAKIASIHHAVTLLGVGNIIKLVIADCSKSIGYSRALPGYGLGPAELWKHGFSCALISQLLAEKLRYKDSHELFTAALLHDVGKLVIDSFIADDFEAMSSLMQEDRFGCVEAEKAYFGIDHAELGGMIAKSWNFPPSLVDAIESHHQSILTAEEANLQTLTLISNHIYHIQHITPKYLLISEHDEILYQNNLEGLKFFNLSQKDIEDIIEAYPNELKRATDFLELPA
jgi:putative nucleotidyltransferase with HDIG domain